MKWYGTGGYATVVLALDRGVEEPPAPPSRPSGLYRSGGLSNARPPEGVHPQLERSHLSLTIGVFRLVPLRVGSFT